MSGIEDARLASRIAGTITGYEGHTVLGGGVEFSPTSKDGDGSVHFEGAFVGTVYVERRWPDAYNRPDYSVTAFRALDPDTYETLGDFPTQREAIDCLVDEGRKHRYAPEDDSPDSRCGDCNKREDSRLHVGEPDYRYWPK